MVRLLSTVLIKGMQCSTLKYFTLFLELQVRVMVGQDEMIRRAFTSAETRVTALVASLAY